MNSIYISKHIKLGAYLFWYFISVLQTFQLKVKFNNTLPRKLMTVRGGTVMEVEDKKDSYNLMYTVLHWLRLAAQRDVEEIPFAAFNQSCIGVHSDIGFKAELFIKSIWFLYFLSSQNILYCSLTVVKMIFEEHL